MLWIELSSNVCQTGVQVISEDYYVRLYYNALYLRLKKKKLNILYQGNKIQFNPRLPPLKQ